MTIMFIVIKIVIKIAIIIIVNREKGIAVDILVISYDGVVWLCHVSY